MRRPRRALRLVATGRRGRLYADRKPWGRWRRWPGVPLGTSRHYRAVASELNPGERIQRTELIGIAAASCRLGRRCLFLQWPPAGLDETSLFRRLRAVGNVRADRTGSQRRARAGRGSGRRNHRSARPRDGPFKRAIPAVAAGIVAIGTNSFRRTGLAVACAVSAVVRLCRPGPDMEKQLARFRQTAGGHQADGA